MTDMRTPYPLTWPAGWPRARLRKDAQFSRRTDRGEHAHVTLAVARERLQEQLDKLGAKEALLSTNVELTLSGAPRSGKGDPVDPGAAIYFKMKGRDTALACDRWRRVADNIVALAKHIEALRGMDRWGVGTIEQAFTGYAALAAPVAKRHWTAIFGVGEDASIEIINTRYRALSKAAPEYPGGAEKRQLELNLARDEALAARALT